MTWFRFVAEWKYTVCKEITQTSTNTPTHMHTCTHWFSKLNKNYVFKLKGVLFSRGCALISSLAFSWAKFLATAFVPSKYFFRKQSPACLIFFSTTTFFSFVEMMALKRLMITKVQIPWFKYSLMRTSHFCIISIKLYKNRGGIHVSSLRCFPCGC